MATISQAPAALDIVAVKGDDLTITLTITENGVAYDWTGATVATSILDASGTAVATNFTTATPANGTLTLTLTDTQTSTLGVATYRWQVNVTKASATRTWLAGVLSVMQPGWAGTSTSSASLSITTGAATLALSTLAGTASTISISDSSGFYAATNVEDALAELMTTRPTAFEMPPDAYISVPRIDIVATEVCSSTMTATTQRQQFVIFSVSRKITINTLAFASDTTASASLTTGILGLYFQGDDGQLYPATKSANDTTIFNTVQTIYSKTFDTTSGWPASVTLVPGRFYAASLLLIGTTMPTLTSTPQPRTGVQLQSRSRRSNVVTSFVDWLSTVNLGTTSTGTPWCRVLSGGTANQARTAVLLGDSFFNSYCDWFGRGNAQGGSRLHPKQNKGAGGETLAQMLARWSTDVAAFNPEWCVLHGGTNDVFAEQATSATIQARYESIIALAQTAGIKLLICTPPSNTAASTAQKTTLAAVRSYLLGLNTSGVTVVDTGIALTTGDGVTANASLIVDTVHPNAAGITALANALAPTIALIS